MDEEKGKKQGIHPKPTKQDPKAPSQSHESSDSVVAENRKPTTGNEGADQGMDS